MIHFVLGGARSGKSKYAEQQVQTLASKLNKAAVYIATATAIDVEMGKRIKQHQSDRGDSWQLMECPLALAQMLTDLDNNNVYLLDCLTLWLNNQLYAVHEASNVQQGKHLQTEIDNLMVSLSSVKTELIIVSNEIGLGVVPMGESTRLYVDYCGWLNQKVAGLADKVTLVTAGIPLNIKNSHECQDDD
ncbi:MULTISPECIES: bifunctional adenosylcobinamide kinase/adenosylcobinamide-phosphate guanylyltransferase [Colwellia]|uniref:Bifunctional adenosylcobalamin biosynthesis protein n=1 Tax=Colwellia marinimaniae TaxID=1513592 RepID=A0ABQ0MSM4_9GAMM|nr:MULTISPECIES: bifunctional adenosylcobinamide kinase/adenosylcobinamide-phosphate guanylyltransferase [Colwellia]GAW95375.1 adenosylcobinamide kinase/adenosylcobinamide phosphate guanyltransferase [Colwellia marinimaniae]